MFLPWICSLQALQPNLPVIKKNFLLWDAVYTWEVHLVKVGQWRCVLRGEAQRSLTPRSAWRGEGGLSRDPVPAGPSLSSTLCRPLKTLQTTRSQQASPAPVFQLLFFLKTILLFRRPPLSSLPPRAHLSLWPDYFSLFLVLLPAGQPSLLFAVTVAAWSWPVYTWPPPHQVPLPVHLRHDPHQWA